MYLIIDTTENKGILFLYLVNMNSTKLYIFIIELAVNY